MMATRETAPSSLLEVIRAGLKGRCPRCGEGRVFKGFLAIGPHCTVCGLDFVFADSADGPAVFVILIVGFVIAGGALLTEVAYGPPIWLHFVLWPPLVLIFCLGALRPLKGVLIAVQYHHRAEQGRIDSID
jgi:uncharacterized protein (DUF983 family)